MIEHDCHKYLKLIEENTDMNGYHNDKELGLFRCECCGKGWQMSKSTYEKITLKAIK